MEQLRKVPKSERSDFERLLYVRNWLQRARLFSRSFFSTNKIPDVDHVIPLLSMLIKNCSTFGGEKASREVTPEFAAPCKLKLKFGFQRWLI